MIFEKSNIRYIDKMKEVINLLIDAGSTRPIKYFQFKFVLITEMNHNSKLVDKFLFSCFGRSD